MKIQWNIALHFINNDATEMINEIPRLNVTILDLLIKFNKP